jgi:tRNA wybutosine-synthesizing protein 3
MAGMDPWQRMKASALRRLGDAVACGGADGPALPLLRRLNAKPDYFTSSSCWGRICLIDFAGAKGVSRFVRRWHRRVSPAEVRKALASAQGRCIWLRAEPLILHISCRDLAAAKRVLDAKNAAGVKRGGLFHVGRSRLQVELEGTQRMEALLKAGGKLLVSDDYLRRTVAIANRRLKENEKDWKRLEKELNKI